MVDEAGSKPHFMKRYLPGPLHVIRQILRSNIAVLKLVFSSSASRISRAFAERLNLSVCSVNECAYCTHLHTKTALKAGVTGEQAADILSGELGSVPVDESRAIAFARYWADQGGWDRTDRYGALEETYGDGRARTILATLHLIQAGNMCSNTAEAFRLGVVRERKVRFFFAWLLAAPVAFFVKVMGGYKEPKED